MDHIKILKRSWHILWRYKALWVFGIILALTTASWQASSAGGGRGRGSNNGNGGDINYNFEEGLSWELKEDVGEGMREFVNFIEATTPENIRNWAIIIGIALLCTTFILYVISRFAHYISETALIQMVNEYEETGEQLSVRQGFRIGWSRTSWRLFLIDLLVNVPAAMLFIVLFAISLTPLLLLASGEGIVSIIAVVTTIGLFFLTIFFAIITNVVLSLLKYFIKRACVIGKLGVRDSFRQGFAVVKQNLKDVGIMWLIMVGVNLGFSILTIPVGFILLLSAVVFGGLAALIAGGLGGLFLDGAAPWIMAGIAGIPVFFLVMFVPLTFLGGLRMVFVSSTWTLTYRELASLTMLDADVPLRLDEPDSDDGFDDKDDKSSEEDDIG